MQLFTILLRKSRAIYVRFHALSATRTARSVFVSDSYPLARWGERQLSTGVSRSIAGLRLEPVAPNVHASALNSLVAAHHSSAKSVTDRLTMAAGGAGYPQTRMAETVMLFKGTVLTGSATSPASSTASQVDKLPSVSLESAARACPLLLDEA